MHLPRSLADYDWIWISKITESFTATYEKPFIIILNLGRCVCVHCIVYLSNFNIEQKKLSTLALSLFTHSHLSNHMRMLNKQNLFFSYRKTKCIKKNFYSNYITDHVCANTQPQTNTNSFRTHSTFILALIIRKSHMHSRGKRNNSEFPS